MELAERRRRVRERGAEVAREAILNAGQEIFAQRGFSGARVDDIAEASGYNKALLFHYFSDKLGLYQAVMGRTKGRMFERLHAAFEHFALTGDAAPTREQVESLLTESFRSAYDYLVAHREVARMMAWEAAEGWQTFTRCAPPDGDNPLAKHVRHFLRRAQEAGIVRRELDIEQFLATATSLPLIHVISLPRYEVLFPDTDFSSPAALERAREQIIALVLDGMLMPPTGAKES
jgi:TetR/AcrR family transcriptional regulator